MDADVPFNFAPNAFVYSFALPCRWKKMRKLRNYFHHYGTLHCVEWKASNFRVMLRFNVIGEKKKSSSRWSGEQRQEKALSFGWREGDEKQHNNYKQFWFSFKDKSTKNESEESLIPHTSPTPSRFKDGRGKLLPSFLQHQANCVINENKIIDTRKKAQ